jgi:hypothetical protein
MLNVRREASVVSMVSECSVVVGRWYFGSDLWCGVSVLLSVSSFRRMML